MFGDRATHVIGDLAGFVERAAEQQHAEFVAADARHGVRIAHRIAQDLGQFAQQAVAGDVAARVVHELETVEVEIAEDVRAVATAGRLGGLHQPPLELAAVDEPGQRVVRCLVGHLARHAAHFRDVVQQHHGAGQRAARVAQRRGERLDGALFAAVAGHQQRAARRVHRRAAFQHMAHGIGDRAALGLIDQRHDVLEAPPLRLDARGAGERFRRGIHEIDPALRVGDHYAFRERLEGILERGAGRGSFDGRRSARNRGQPQRGHRLRRHDLDARDQDSGTAVVVDHGGGDLEAAHAALQADDVDLEAVGCRLARELAAQAVLDEFGAVGGDDVREAPAGEHGALDADEVRELAVGVEDHVTMHHDDLVDAIAEVGEQGRAQALSIGLGAHARQQVVDGGAERGELGLVGLQFDAPRQPPTDRDPLHLTGQRRDGPQLAPLEQVEHEQQHRHQREQDTH